MENLKKEKGEMYMFLLFLQTKLWQRQLKGKQDEKRDRMREGNKITNRKKKRRRKTKKKTTKKGKKYQEGGGKEIR